MPEPASGHRLRPIATTLFIVCTNRTPCDRAGVAMIGSPISLVATWRNVRSAATTAIAPSDPALFLCGAPCLRPFGTLGQGVER